MNKGAVLVSQKQIGLGDRKSTSRYLFLIAGGPVSWRSKKQDSVALSTAEAEYVALSSAAQKCVWTRRLNCDLRNPPKGPTVILEDNQSSIVMAKNPQFHGRAKHIDIKCHFIREQVSNGTIDLKYCPKQDMVADMLPVEFTPREGSNVDSEGLSEISHVGGGVLKLHSGTRLLVLCVSL